MIQQFGSGPGGLNPAILFSRFAPLSARILGQQLTPLANGANTDFVFQLFANIRAGLLSRNGDALRIYARYSLSAAVSTKTFQLQTNFSATGVGGFTGGTGIASMATAVASNDVDFTAYIVRLGAQSSAFWASAQFITGGFAQGTLYQTTAGWNWNNALPIGIGIKDSVGNLAAITLQFSQIDFIPAII